MWYYDNEMKKPYLALATSIVAVSFAAIFIRLCEAPPLSISFYRLFFTTALLLPIVVFYSPIRSELLQLEKKTLAIMVLIGCILAAHFALWITSLTMTSVASSVILVTAHPILVGPLSYYFLKEKLSAINAIGISLSIVGVITLVWGNYGLPEGALDTLEGNILAILGGVAAGLYILGGRTIRRSVSIFTYATPVYAVGAIVLFALCLFTKSPVYNLSIQDYQIIFAMALISGIFGHTLYNWSLGHIRASVASVFLLGEPIGSSILAWLIPSIHEVPSLFTIIGGAIILLGIYLTARESKKVELSPIGELG